MTVKNSTLSILSYAMLALAAVVVFYTVYTIHHNELLDTIRQPAVVPIANLAPTPTQTSPAAVTAIPTSTPTSTPPQSYLNLPIPFTPQAPTGNWDELHNEACEEAAAIMANAYLTGDQDEVMPPAQVETQISNLTVWEDQNFGYHLDTTAAETAQMIEHVYGLTATVVENYTLQDIKNELDQHHVVILPVDGQNIGNPHYKTPGPIYHMLVIRGYSGDNLITDDSGTKYGENYTYPFETLYNAAADWDHSTNTITQSRKLMIVVSK